MCFSASASFAAAGGLAVIGGVSLSVAKKEDRALAAIPLMFSLQQACEGVQWLYLNSGSTSPIAAYGFLFFAYIVWPVYVPMTVWVLDKKRRPILIWFVAAGVAVAAYFLETFEYVPMIVEKVNMCIVYEFHQPLEDFGNAFYLLAIFGSLLASSMAIFRWYGVAICILATVAWAIYSFAFTSVWCFFAAIVSVMFFVYMESKRHPEIAEKILEKI